MSENLYYRQLADDLADSGIVPSSMFGMPVLKLGRKPICGLTEDGLNFKLPVGSTMYDTATSLPGAHLFQPEMRGKKGPLMKQWVVVPFEHHGLYPAIAMESIKFVASETT